MPAPRCSSADCLTSSWREYKRARGSLGDVTDDLLASGGARQPKREVVVGVSGASGLIYAVDLLAAIKRAGVRSSLVVSAGAKLVAPTELPEGLKQLKALADVDYKDSDLGAPIASGSHLTVGMVIAPCSASTLAKVAQGHADTLITRAAHVTLKERRPLVLVLREAPYSRPMLVNMLAAHDAGATVLPAAPGFYHNPTDIGELVAGVTSRALDLLGVANDHAPRWRSVAE